jgi:hypothetical protein
MSKYSVSILPIFTPEVSNFGEKHRNKMRGCGNKSSLLFYVSLEIPGHQADLTIIN